MQLKARLLLAAVAVTASAGLALGTAAPLAAASAPHVVDGSGAAYNDWGDEGTLSVNSHSKSNATRLWQSVLYADGAKWKDSSGTLHTFTAWDIDGVFGWKTRSATKYWQAQEDLEDVDGIVGKETFGQADGFLDGPAGDGGVTYAGLAHEVDFKRLDGDYYVRIGSKWKVAAYDWRG
ncbi:peptidoglycan-binding domain-containing protein [Streptomyces caniscabiei]|uniref:peptidoglycan-binding domain-containing protein n=1 Tax=Streptomyces TaxID=1883 RepID=UPI0029BA7333|nr:peptidoglycan-binding domain-containing protein [Streptomyces caniscabiei]MDX2601261.1 peptidoglycan-binding domain-containing protein [Streptomyces caniscabiei]MDX2738923.1 peptidoglycan-binding domain-containing protein [Streptomyces caniscabiei]MDX2784896.1 peptidoglycan-binding domain-containing protein [Streptomyces caniscabiei]